MGFFDILTLYVNVRSGGARVSEVAVGVILAHSEKSTERNRAGKEIFLVLSFKYLSRLEIYSSTRIS